ncbi:MAG: holo-ACP synthase [Fimbriimonas sp.]|nr:holo-ACP synthase [Fimbriimonas sp.]
MVVGLGIDIVEIARIEAAMRHPRFLERILTPVEIEFCTTPAKVAGRWAAKEAIAKAVGLHLSWQDVEVLPDEMGLPVARVSSHHFDPNRLRLKISISHERSNAVAVAILERVVIHAPGSLM